MLNLTYFNAKLETMVIRNEEEINRLRIRIKECVETDRRLKDELRKNKKIWKSAEEYLASVLETPISEISLDKSLTDHLEEILRKHKRPMKAVELLNEIQAIPGLSHTAATTLNTTLLRNSGKGKRFRKVSTGMYEILKEEETE